MPTAQIARPGDLKSNIHPWQGSVKNASLATPPAFPAPGDRYIVAIGATGAWAGHDNQIAYAKLSGWGFYSPLKGWMVWDENSDKLLTFSGTAWEKSKGELAYAWGNHASAGYLNASSPITSPVLNYIVSRGMNLVTNGYGSLATNYNFSQLTYDAVELYAGLGSFRSNVASMEFTCDEMVLVDPQKYYRGTLYAKSTVLSTNNRILFGIAPFDARLLAISSVHFMRYQGAANTILAEQLDPGDTQIVLADGTGWSNEAAGYTRNLVWYPYIDDVGRVYPDYSYSRNITIFTSDFYTNGLWAVGGVSGNVITLRSPWAGPTLPINTKVANSTAGGTYPYCFGNYIQIPADWTKVSGVIGGTNDTGTYSDILFPPGTAFIKLFMYLNYGSGSNQMNISAVSLTEITSENIFSGGLPAYANNAAAIAAGLVAGKLYRTGGDPDQICIVH
jgi:hypothetical protein